MNGAETAGSNRPGDGPGTEFEQTTREREERFLSARAIHSYPADRPDPEPDSQWRTPFQRDRDRIVHSKSFRRLMHKTQVFIAPEGDHYRTRLTHTLEASGIARTVARALRLNEDLTEAIGLAHDLGHPPFGHIGEHALDEASKAHGGPGFKHNEHSLRVVDVLERDGRGLNLNQPVREGILRHTGPLRSVSLEGQIVRLVDRVAYINHDIDDALRAGILRSEDLPRDEIALLGPTGASRIDSLVKDIVDQSWDGEEIRQSEHMGMAMLRLRKFMFDNVYLGEEARRDHDRVHGVIRALFEHYLERPELIPELDPAADPIQRVTDLLAGMTDRYCIAHYTAIYVPEGSRF